jgi:general secretion pathway protein E
MKSPIMDFTEIINNEQIDLSLIREVPFTFSRNNRILPLKKEDGHFIAAVVDDQGLFAVSELAKRYGLGMRCLRVEEEPLIAAISHFYGQLGTAAEVMDNISGDDLTSVATEFEKPRDLLELIEDAPIIRLLNALFQQAVKEKASDIHIEPYERELEVRMRIDGILHKVLKPPKIIQEALVSRVKIMASLDIAEKRLPQDGRISLLVGGQDVDLRVSVIPTVFGERVVMRLLNRKQGLIGLSEMGLDEEDKASFENLLSRTSGIILVTGPTGSGKTTTLYAALNRIYTEEKNVVTIEDPVEYQLTGIGQIHVNPKIGLTFASGLRSILRQDPDIIMVGEIRDYETAEIAIQASLTGHLVLSTLHTIDASSAVIRLGDMGVEPFLVASSLSAVLAQRLVRTLCPYCREEYAITPAEQAYLNADVSTLSRGKGCERCKGSGYSGRTGIFEFLMVDGGIRQMISERASAQDIKKSASQKGMQTLFDNGLNKVVRGITTLQEVLRVTQKDYVDISI